VHANSYYLFFNRHFEKRWLVGKCPTTRGFFEKFLPNREEKFDWAGESAENHRVA
jgi:hypothetical protein